MAFAMPAVLRVHIRLFQFFGLFTLSLDRNPKRRQATERLLMLWAVLLFMAYTCLAFTAVAIQDTFLFTNDIFGTFNDVLKIVFTYLAIIAMYCESLLKRRELRRFWQIYDVLQKRHASAEFAAAEDHCCLQLRHHRCFLFIFYGTAVAEIALEITFVCLEEKSQQVKYFWSMFLPCIYAAYTRNMQFIFHMEIMRRELKNLQNDLRLLVDYTKFSRHGASFKGFEEFLRRKLVAKQEVYQAIYEMFRNFQSAFGYSMVAVLWKIYVRILVDAYFTYYSNDRGPNSYENYLLIVAPLEITAFFIVSSDCMNMVKHITHELHSIINTNGCQTIATQVQNFSLQILHQKIRIDGVGIGAMDGYMLMGAVGTITIYMIFFIQFMPTFQAPHRDK